MRVDPVDLQDYYLNGVTGLSRIAEAQGVLPAGYASEFADVVARTQEISSDYRPTSVSFQDALDDEPVPQPDFEMPGPLVFA